MTESGMSGDVEIIAADPVLRRRFIIIATLLVTALAIAYATVGNPATLVLEWLFNDVMELNTPDQDAARENARNVIFVAMAIVWLSSASVAGYTVVLGLRMQRAGQWPLPGARLIAARKVIRNRELRLRAALAIGVPIVTLIPITYYVLKIVWWAHSRI